MLALILLATATPSAPPADRAPTRTLTVTPAPEPRPALKFDLFPRVRDRQPGNAAIAYYRAITQRPTPPNDPKEIAREQENFEKWMTCNLDEFPAKDVREYLDRYATSLREIDRATNCDRCDFETLPRLRVEGINLLLGEIQECRTLAKVLALRTRLELAEKNFTAAAKSVRSGFQLAKNIGEGPTLIQLLVGLAIETVFLERVEEWIARPGSPNLYWALTQMPRPLIESRQAFQGEELFLEAFVPSLGRLRGAPLPKDEAARLIEGIFRELAGSRMLLEGVSDVPAGERVSPGEKLLTDIGIVFYIAWAYGSARNEMIQRGSRPEVEIAKMPAAQIVFLNSYERFLELRDAQWKWIGLPFHLAAKPLQDVTHRLKKARAEYRLDFFFTIFSLLLPAVDRVIWATARTERRFAAVRTLEAIRMATAANGGKSPAKLADITATPVPDDPVTGKPFEYTATATGWILKAPPPEKEPANPQNSLDYAVTIRPGK